jgi:hypothetical protein
LCDKPLDDENRRTGRLARFEVPVRLSRVLQRVRLIDLDPDATARIEPTFLAGGVLCCRGATLPETAAHFFSFGDVGFSPCDIFQIRKRKEWISAEIHRSKARKPRIARLPLPMRLRPSSHRVGVRDGFDDLAVSVEKRNAAARGKNASGFESRMSPCRKPS